jgi:ABC-type branched-subunit amino acid transport system permease subunit
LIYNHRLRVTVASLWFVGVALAGFTAPLAWRRTGVASALPFIAAAAGLALFGVGVLRANRVALTISTAALGAQILGVIGSAWELAQGVHSSKARELRRLGVDPTLGVTLNLVYSAAASVVFAWVVTRWRAGRRGRVARWRTASPDG